MSTNLFTYTACNSMYIYIYLMYTFVSFIVYKFSLFIHIYISINCNFLCTVYAHYMYLYPEKSVEWF